MKKKYAIGIDLGGTNLRCALVSREGTIIRKIKEPTSKDLLPSVLRLIENLFSDEVLGVGLGVAGLIDRKRSRVLISPNLPGVEHIDFITGIRQRFNVPVRIENDANAAAFGELTAGAGKDLSNFVLFTLGTGIGGGIICDGKLLGVSAEIGHMSIDADGEKCPCGNNGCLESYASARAILSKAVSFLEKGGESLLKGYCGGNFYKLTSEDISRAALDGDMPAREILKNRGTLSRGRYRKHNKHYEPRGRDSYRRPRRGLGHLCERSDQRDVEKGFQRPFRQGKDNTLNPDG